MKTSLAREQKNKIPDHMVGFVSEWLGHDAAGDPDRRPSQSDTKDGIDFSSVENRPIEPEEGGIKGPGILKWLLFLLIVAYALISYYHVPLLTALGNHLILDHPVQKADLIVCTPGPPLEQCLTAAQHYEKGLAPRIYIPREPAPAGLNILIQQGGRYPESSDLFLETLRSLNVPESACMVGRRPVESVWEEAEALGEWVLRNEVRSMIVVVPPWKARRTYRVFRRLLGGKDAAIMISPSRFSDFESDAWWKRDRYRGLVVMEYQRLIYDALRGIW